MAVYSLCQPLTSLGTGRGGLTNGLKDVSSSYTSQPCSAMVSSASHVRSEAARLCKQASMRTESQNDRLVSTFWSKDSGRGLLAKTSSGETVYRTGRHLLVVRA